MSKVAEIVTEKIVALLEQGNIPWRKPWTGSAPANLISKKEYRGINIFLLEGSSFKSKWWLTVRQAVQLGGRIKYEEIKKPTLAIFWKMLDRKEVREDGSKDTRKIPFLRYYNLFNLEQTEGIDPKHIPVEVKREHKPIAEAEEVIRDYADKPPIKHGGNAACYSPSLDEINMPHPENFKSGEGYYSTLFHECTHSTRHEKRLNRDRAAEGPYAEEELVAEMGSAFLAGECGFESVEQPENSAAYIASWLRALNNDKSLVVRAASRAQKAVDYIRGRVKDNAPTEKAEKAEEETAEVTA
jgi:antirestriction protein ArdC